MYKWRMDFFYEPPKQQKQHILCLTCKGSNTHFVDIVQTNDGIKVCVEVVEQVDHLDGFTESRDGCETHDVTEVQRDLVEMFGYDGFAGLQRLGHRPETQGFGLLLKWNHQLLSVGEPLLQTNGNGRGDAIIRT